MNALLDRRFLDALNGKSFEDTELAVLLWLHLLVFRLSHFLPIKSDSSHRGEVKAFGHIGGWSDSVRKRLLLTKPDKMFYFYFTESKIGGG